MADIFDVVADPTRRDLLQVLLDRYVNVDSDSGEISVGEIVDKMGLSQPTVSKHLKVLRDHGLVTVREEGQHRYYSIDTSPLEELEDWLIPFLSADFDTATEAASSAVFAAWSGVQVPEPFRRAADTLQHPADAGTAVGRAAAAASFQARTALYDASQNVERRVIDPIKKKLGRKDDK
ncbi:MAG TPA: ArsR family transcriptional regulator [Microbacteriaceae bacterium]|jgi:DNA-binding transcriptional ArsR family regulator|nr:ArsR family transcriptional regulator [Microbacteriaceae bacterium]